MAIKGKSRPRSRRAVTQGPRPAYTPVKRPILARRGFWIGVLVVVVAGAAAGIWYGLAHERTQARERALTERERSAALTFQGAVEGAIAGVGQASPPDSFNAFPALGTDVDGLSRATVTPEAATADAKAAENSAGKAWRALDSFDVARTTANRGFDATFVNYFFNAKQKLEDALKLYERAAVIVRRAAAETGSQRAALLGDAKSLLGVGGDLMNAGYSDYVQVQFLGHIYRPNLGPAPVGS
jgi:hypothetical protein